MASRSTKARIRSTLRMIIRPELGMVLNVVSTALIIDSHAATDVRPYRWAWLWAATASSRPRGCRISGRQRIGLAGFGC